MLERNSPFLRPARAWRPPPGRPPPARARRGPCDSRDELLQDDLLTQVPEGVEDASAPRRAWGDHHAHALRAPEQLDDGGQPADLVHQLARCWLPSCAITVRGMSMPDRASSCRQRSLSRLREMALRVVQHRHAHRLQVAHHRQPVAGDGGADAGDDHVQAADLDAAVEHARVARGEHHVAAQGVQHQRAVARAA